MDMATYMTMSRDLSQCDQFYSQQLASSPLALLQRLVGHYSAFLELLIFTVSTVMQRLCIHIVAP